VEAAINVNAGSLAAATHLSGTITTPKMGEVASAVVGAGTMKITSAGTMNVNSSSGCTLVSLFNPSTLSLDGGGFSSASGNLTATGINTSSTLTLAGLTKVGTGTLTLTSPTTYTGPTIATGGTLNINSPSIQAGNVTLSGGSTLQLSGGNSGIAGGVIVNGGGQLTLSGTNTYAGFTTISNGVLQSATGQISPGNSALVFNGGVLQSNGLKLDGGISYIGQTPIQAGTLTLAKSPSTVAVLDNPVGAVALGSGLTKTGTGTLILTGGLVYSGIGSALATPLDLSLPNYEFIPAINGSSVNVPSITQGVLTINPAAAIPEPSTFLLLIGAGIGGVLGNRWRRNGER
jgi:fibronectin-binding autotransporter adhesin